LFLAKAAEHAPKPLLLLTYDTKTKRYVADYKQVNVV
jgi:hypothetical protein